MQHNDIIIKENLKALHTAITQIHSLSKASVNCKNPKSKLILELGLVDHLQAVRDILNGDQLFKTNLSFSGIGDESDPVPPIQNDPHSPKLN